MWNIVCKHLYVHQTAMACLIVMYECAPLASLWHMSLFSPSWFLVFSIWACQQLSSQVLDWGDHTYLSPLTSIIYTLDWNYMRDLHDGENSSEHCFIQRFVKSLFTRHIACACLCDLWYVQQLLFTQGERKKVVELASDVENFIPKEYGRLAFKLKSVVLKAHDWRIFALFISEFVYSASTLNICRQFRDAWSWFVRFMRLAILPFLTNEQTRLAQSCLVTFLELYPAACRAQYNVWKAAAKRRKEAADAKRQRLNDGSKRRVDPKPRVERFAEDECIKPNMHFILHLMEHIRALGTTISAYVWVHITSMSFVNDTTVMHWLSVNCKNAIPVSLAVSVGHCVLCMILCHLNLSLKMCFLPWKSKHRHKTHMFCNV